jgi:D-glycero-D-manno-heptose 1,7-bisphosphate phosphatase
MLKKALFLDRDGTINIDKYCVHKINDFQFIDGVFETLCEIQKRGYLLIIVTNQSGIGRGMYSEEDFLILSDWMNAEFLKHDVTINGLYYSPYHPDLAKAEFKKHTNCRKPRPGMILKATNDYSIDLSRSFLVGDKETDIMAGINAGIGCNILFNKNITVSQANHVIEEFESLLNIVM